MSREKQLVCLELSQKLKKAGYKQEGVWWWRRFTKKHPWGIVSKDDEDLDGRYSFTDDDLIVAPTVAELGERLPNSIQKDNNRYI